MRKHTLLALAALVALAVPVAASANDREVHGPAVFHGHGWFGGELEMRSLDDTRPIGLGINRGRVGILDIGGDARVTCGDRPAATHETGRGTVLVCQGRHLEVAVVGSHIRFRGVGGRIVLKLPEGTSGTLHGLRPEGDRVPSSERERSADRRVDERPERPTAPSPEGDAASR